MITTDSKDKEAPMFKDLKVGQYFYPYYIEGHLRIKLPRIYGARCSYNEQEKISYNTYSFESNSLCETPDDLLCEIVEKVEIHI